MKKNLFFLVFVFLSAAIFALDSTTDLGLGFQYGFSRIFEGEATLREITEPGPVFSFRYGGKYMGFYTRFGMLFPDSVTEGSTTLDHTDNDRIMFTGTGFGPSFKIPMGKRFALVLDLGMNINNLGNGSSFRDTLDASWTGKLAGFGVTFSAGHIYDDIKLVESYNDFAIGVGGNAALRFRFNERVSLEIGASGSYDFWRIKTYRFSVDFTSGDYRWPYWAMNDFPREKLTISTEEIGWDYWLDEPIMREYATSMTLRSESKFSRFNHYTIMPNISIIVSF